MENRFSFIEALLHLRFLEYLLGCFIVFLRRIGWNISGPMVRLIRTFLQRNGRRINDIRRNTLYEKCRVFPDNFVGKEAQRHKCREFCRQNVGFVSKARKKFVFHKTVPNGNRTRDPHFYIWILTFKRQLGRIFIRLNNMKSAQVDLHKKRANNPTFCRIPKNERKIALHNFEFPYSKLYVDHCPSHVTSFCSLYMSAYSALVMSCLTVNHSISSPVKLSGQHSFLSTPVFNKQTNKQTCRS